MEGLVEQNNPHPSSRGKAQRGAGLNMFTLPILLSCSPGPGRLYETAGAAEDAGVPSAQRTRKPWDLSWLFWSSSLGLTFLCQWIMLRWLDAHLDWDLPRITCDTGRPADPRLPTMRSPWRIFSGPETDVFPNSCSYFLKISVLCSFSQLSQTAACAQNSCSFISKAQRTWFYARRTRSSSRPVLVAGW